MLPPLLIPALVVVSFSQDERFERELSAVPRFETVVAQREHALALAARVRSARPADLPIARRACAFAWIAVRRNFPQERAAVADAAFRAAEQLRWVDEDLAALREFEVVRAMATDTTLRARAVLESAHLERRRRNVDRALDLYLGLCADASAPPRRRDEAALWVGKSYALLGRFADAERWLRRAAERACHALDRVRAFDEWCALFVSIDDLEAAAGVLATCRASLAPVVAEETKLGESVRDALEGMRSIELLERAVARRRVQREDPRTAKLPFR